MPGVDDVRGPAFPFAIDPASGGVAVAEGADKLRANLRVLLGTRLGERPMLREYGTRLRSLVHEPNDDVLSSLALDQLREAVLRWEPRVMVVNSRFEREEGELRLWLDYVQVNDRLAGQLVLPLA
jgi:Bacteriophage baseplate protein W